MHLCTSGVCWKVFERCKSNVSLQYVMISILLPIQYLFIHQKKMSNRREKVFCVCFFGCYQYCLVVASRHKFMLIEKLLQNVFYRYYSTKSNFSTRNVLKVMGKNVGLFFWKCCIDTSYFIILVMYLMYWSQCIVTPIYASLKKIFILCFISLRLKDLSKQNTQPDRGLCGLREWHIISTSCLHWLFFIKVSPHVRK